ncbi:efflux transporter outer membrane subunit [Fodinicurvata sediminis]|uniref:efflux transporter outer membrane subunit n=1 Tax=Fodinicurvata sediminis TaxID=1121832 RepID=UPI0004180BDD|nr:efflux transporter outer membrane subunit [Fodinicurvata sediminis]
MKPRIYPGLRTAAGALCLAVLASCTTVGPDFEAPEPEVPSSYDAPVPSRFQGNSSKDHWWELFEDSTLSDLVRLGLDQNLEIRTAASRVREARAQAEGVTAQSTPNFDLSGEGSGSISRSLGDSDYTRSGSLDAILDGSWEIDLFGRLARSEEAAWARAEREEALRREAIRLTTAEIVRNFINLRAEQQRLSLTERSLDLQEQTLKLVQQRVASGLAPGLDEVRAQASLSSLRADLGPIRSDMKNYENALATLVDRVPGSLSAMLEGREPIPDIQDGHTVGMPLDMVRNRPDIHAAELQVAAATAEIGVAIAELYPRLTLPGTLSLSRSGIGTENIVNTIMGTLSLLLQVPLYDGGERRAEVTAAEERAEQALLNYRDTLLTALQEVEATLLNYRGTALRIRSLEEAVENNRLAYEQSQELYRQGFASFIDVLDSQRELTTSEQQLAEAERQLGLETVNLYAALGSGIEEEGRGS